jgi:hypothetical protein
MSFSLSTETLNNVFLFRPNKIDYIGGNQSLPVARTEIKTVYTLSCTGKTAIVIFASLQPALTPR